jgi:hypothetical protein
MTFPPPTPGTNPNSTEPLPAAAAQGHVRMDPGVADRAARRCQDAAERLDVHRGRLSSLAGLQCGTSSSGVALGQQLDDKIHGGDGSITAVLAQEARTLLDMADAFRAAGAATREQDEAAAQSLPAPS